MWSIQTMGCLVSAKINALSSHEMTQRNLKSVLISEWSQYEKAAYYRMPTTWHPGKGKAMETVHNSVISGNSMEEREGQIGGQEMFKAVMLFCQILSWCVHITKPTECTTQSEL